MQSRSDGDLVRAIASQTRESREAEAELCRRFAPRVRLYGLRHLRDEERARDLVQTVLLAVIEAARVGRIDDADRVDRFMLGTCRNAAARIREVAARARVVPPDAPELDVAVTEAEVEHVDTTALVRCLSTLDERMRGVVMLSFQRGQSAEEIASLYETTAGNVRVLRHRGIAQLRRCLDGRKEGEA